MNNKELSKKKNIISRISFGICMISLTLLLQLEYRRGVYVQYIDDFKNTMDFNAVSAEMNKYITVQMAKFQIPEDGKFTFVGAVAVPPHSSDMSSLAIIPYLLKK